MADISNRDDIIDSRDVIDRIEFLEELRDDGDEGFCEEEAEELEALTKLAQEAEDYAPDWHYGETLIRESYFPRYVQELLADCGDIPSNIPNYVEIDWEATARNVKVDYTEVEFDGVTYLIR